VYCLWHHGHELSFSLPAAPAATAKESRTRRTADMIILASRAHSMESLE